MTPSLTEQISLAQLSARLASNDVIAGVVWVGTTGTESHKAHSDYDILLLMRQMPAPLHVVFTTVDSVLTDVIFSKLSVVDRILTADDLTSLTADDGNVMYWLANGRIIHDADGRLQQAQSRLQTESWDAVPAPIEALKVWQKINYNWLQTRRMMTAGDDVYGTAVNLRLLYMLSELTTAYFIVRDRRWDGEKSAIRYWKSHDPDYLTLLERCLAATEQRSRFVLYERLARLTLAPVGGLWSEPATSVSLHGEWGMADWQTAVAFWHDLVTHEPH